MSAHNLPAEAVAATWDHTTQGDLNMFNSTAGILLASGLVLPADATAGYAPGCLFQHVDGGNGTALYVNEGTKASCDFNAITVA